MPMIQSSDEGKDLESKRNILLRQEKKKMSKEGERLWRQRNWARQVSGQKGGSGKNGKDVNSQFSNKTDSSNKERMNLLLIVRVHRSWKFKNMFFKSVSQLVNKHLLMEKEMATHSSILAWKNPWTEESGGLKSRGLHDWACVHEGGRRWVGSNKLVELKKKKTIYWAAPKVQAPCSCSQEGLQGPVGKSGKNTNHKAIQQALC